MLKGYAKSHDLIFIPQYELPKQDGNRRIVDGALVYDLRVPFGYWEAKDEEDELDKEIAAKFRRGYPRIDERIKASYIKQSTAQKTKAYDMYTRFFRWASDRLKDEGIVAFITNRSFVDSRTMDGFRRIAARDFAEVWIVDLGGDVRANPKLSGTKNNVFGIQTGVAISFLVRRRDSAGQCRIFYARRPEMDTKEDKLEFLNNAQLSSLEMEQVRPDATANWINQTDNDFGTLIASADKKAKLSKKPAPKGSVFRLFSLGVVTARDDWVYDFEKKSLEKKVKALIGTYNADMKKWSALKKRDKRIEDLDASIKWSRAVKNDLQNGLEYKFGRQHIIQATYRPFVKSYLYFEKHLNEMQYQLGSIFANEPNPTITFLSVDSSNKLRG